MRAQQIFPRSEGFTLLSNVLWTSDNGHPTLSKQHMWIDFFRPIMACGLVITTYAPIKDIVIETNIDDGDAWRMLAICEIAQVRVAQTVCFDACEINNIRIRVMDEDNDLFPTADNIAKVLVCYEGELETADAQALPFVRIADKAIEVMEPFSGSDRLQIGEKRGLCHGHPETNRLKISHKDGQISYNSPTFRIAFSEDFALMTALCWDTLGNGNQRNNLLSTGNTQGAFPVVMRHGQRLTSASGGGALCVNGRSVAYRDVRILDALSLSYHYEIVEHGFQLKIDWACEKTFRSSELALLRMPFDLYASVTNVLAMPNTEGPSGLIDMPLVINSPNYGTMRVSVLGDDQPVYGRISPFRVQAELWLDIIAGATPLDNGLMEMREGSGTVTLQFELTKAFPPEAGDGSSLFAWWEMPPFYSFVDRERILGALPNAWLNGLSFRPDVGVFANNSVADYAMMCASYYGDIAAYTPALAEGLTAISMLKFATEQMLHEQSAWRYTDHSEFPLAASAPVDCAWLYIAATGDWDWARRMQSGIKTKLDRLFSIEDPETGLIAAAYSGVPGDDGTGVRTASWFDSFRSGHLESYVNAHIYRCFGRAREIMDRLGDAQTVAVLDRKIKRMAKSYLAVFDDGHDGIYQWVDRNGDGHGFGSHAHLGSAIAYGLVPKARAQIMLRAYLARLDEMGFDAYQYGLPLVLDPIPEALHNDWKGKGIEIDGSDQAGIYQNGSITHNQCYHILQALYISDLRKEANDLFIKLTPLARHGGLCGGLHSGIDWRLPNGEPAGYEGLLADQYHFLLAAITGYLRLELTIDGLMMHGSDSERCRKLKPNFARMAE